MTPEPELRVVVWNVEWRAPASAAGAIIRQTLSALNPDLVCLTEAHVDLPDSTGHLICADADYGYELKPGRRKVMLWSRHPWIRVDAIGQAALPPGRYISGRTVTPLGEVDAVGLCVPWSGAHVATGRRDRRRWEDHHAYLAALTGMPPPVHPALVIGDFNQNVPRTRAPIAAFAGLQQALLDRFELATAGPIAPFGEQVIDHLCYTADFRPIEVTALARRGPAGERLSDHLGLLVRLRRA